MGYAETFKTGHFWFLSVDTWAPTKVVSLSNWKHPVQQKASFNVGSILVSGLYSSPFGGGVG